MIERPKLTISILTDALRGTRESPAPCCASLLAPLVTEFGNQRVQISMFHTPNLSGWKKSLIPRRFDEGWGLQHMKLYGFDGEIILSGANLSSDYFTDRQDRYILFSSVKVTQFYRRLHDAVSSISYQVVPTNENAGFTLEWKPSDCPEPIKNPKKFKSFTTTLLRELIKARPLDHCEFTSEKPPSTILYPLAQMTPLLDDSVSTEQPVVNAVLDALALEEHRDTDWYFTAGYFNVFEEYRVRLLRAFGHGTVITASPDANGFYKSSGPSGMLAAAYTLLSKRFLDDAAAAGKNSVIRLLEWQRGLYGNKDRWTYHAKGLWIKPNSVESIGPSLTFIGSSNFTRRSQNLDLEATAVLITADEQLQKQLASEVKNLQAYTTEVHSDNLKTPERRADLKTRFSLWLCQGML